MSVKCPFCQRKLQYDDLLCSCVNEHCEESFDMVGTELLWQKVIDLKQEIDDTRKTLEQSEICCTEWEKQALDYKAENIALSGDLEHTRKALDVARHTIGWINQMIDEHADKQAIKIKCEYALEQITALEQKDKK